MRRSSNPSDVVVSVECYAFFTIFRTYQLQPVVMNEDRGGATLPCVGLHRLFEGVDRQGTVSTVSGAK